jgi:hypothetical protein
VDQYQDEINIHHEPVAVPKHSSPFENRPELHQTFVDNIALLGQAGTLPPGFGLLPDEWEDDGYPAAEHIPYGPRQRTKEISLPHHIWYPRAILWGQALFVLNAIQYESP